MKNNTVSVEILYQDTDIVVINKPGGLLAVPGRGPDKQDCVTARLQQLFEQMIAQPAVHRLDMYTSGVMVYAITTQAHRTLSIQFEKRRVKKRYVALLEGLIHEDKGKIHLPFRLDPANRPLQVYDPQKGKMGVTLWEIIGHEKNTTRVAFTPLTGRTHQLRVHSAHPLGLGTPIVGDSLYGSGSDGDKMFLHATYLRFFHPITDTPVEFHSPTPF